MSGSECSNGQLTKNGADKYRYPQNAVNIHEIHGLNVESDVEINIEIHFPYKTHADFQTWL